MPKLKNPPSRGKFAANQQFVDANFTMSFPAVLIVSDECCGAVFLVATGFDRRLPSSAQIFGDGGLLDAAWEAEHATVTLGDATVPIDVKNMSIETGALIIDSAPIFRALAALAKKPAQAMAFQTQSKGGGRQKGPKLVRKM